MSSEERLYGYLVEFDTVDGVLTAAEQVRDAGYTRWDAHTPFPVHGLDGAMGIRRTRLPLIVFAAGAAGTLGGLFLQWYTNAFDYPWVVSGKPIFSLPANIPVAFETTILLAAFGALLGMLAMNKLPQLYHPLFTSRRFRRVTADRFFISIEADDPQFEPEGTRRFAHDLGGTAVEEVWE